MTSKERIMIALKRLKSDRLPETVHQWMCIIWKHS